MIQLANCKINLGLRILNKRPDGYHNIESVFYPVPWYDIIEVQQDFSGNSEKIRIKITGIEIPDKPENNICVKAYQLLAADYNLPALSVHIHKQIPVGAGLGGGSADAAFFIKAVNKLANLNLKQEQMIAYAADLGSDCAFFINNTPALAIEKGQILKNIDINLSGLYIVIIYPHLHISTAEAYSGVVPSSKGDSLEQLIKEPTYSWKNSIANSFEATIINKYPEIGNIKTRLYQSGAVYASMSGSGSSVYGLFSSKPNNLNYFNNFTVFTTQL